jgi:PAS domain-containing protein
MAKYKSREEFFKSMANAFEGLKCGIVFTEYDIDNPVILWANKYFFNMTQWTAKEVAGKKTPKILQGKYTDRKIIDEMKKTLRKTDAFSGYTWNHKKNGTPFLMEWKIIPIMYDDRKYYMSIHNYKFSSQELKNNKVFSYLLTKKMTLKDKVSSFFKNIIKKLCK